MREEILTLLSHVSETCIIIQSWYFRRTRLWTLRKWIATRVHGLRYICILGASFLQKVESVCQPGQCRLSRTLMQSQLQRQTQFCLSYFVKSKQATSGKNFIIPFPSHTPLIKKKKKKKIKEIRNGCLKVLKNFDHEFIIPTMWLPTSLFPLFFLEKIPPHPLLLMAPL